MTLGEFRERTKNLPDDTNLVIWENGDATWYEANVNQLVESNPIHVSPVYVLDMGQQVELEFDLAVRTGIDDGAGSDEM